jgi:hypothetical protein
VISPTRGSAHVEPNVREFALDSAEVAEEAAVECKEVRRVRPLLSELQVLEGQELAKDRRGWGWRNMLKSIRIRREFVLQVQGIGSFAQRYRVDQRRTQIKRKGNSGGDLHRTAGLSLLRAVGGGSQSAAQPPSPSGSARVY